MEENTVETQLTLLYKLLKESRKLYHGSKNQTDKDNMVRFLYNAIFVLGNPTEFWDKTISIKALELCKTKKNPLLTYNHVYPRSIAMRNLLEIKKDSYKSFKDMMLNIYCKVNIITHQENLSLKKYQRYGVFKNSKLSHRKCDIKLRKINENQLKLVKKQDIETINKIILK